MQKPPGPRMRTGFLAAAVLLVIALVGVLVALTPALADTTMLLVLVVGVIAAFALGAVLLLPSRKRILLGLFIFLVGFSGIDKWLFFRYHTGGAPGIQVSISDIVLITLYALWAWEVLTGQDARRSTTGTGFRRSAVALPVTLALVWIGTSAISLANAADTGFVMFELIQMLKLLAFLIYVAYNIRNRSDLSAGAIGVSAAVFVHGAFAVLERASGGSLGLGILGEQEGVVVDLLGGSFNRVGGLIGHPVLLGAFFATTLALMLAILVRSDTPRARALTLLAILAGAAGLALTLSRGSWIAWAFALFAFLFFAYRKRLARPEAKSLVTVLLALVIVAVIAASPLLYQRFVNSDPGSVEGRTLLNSVAVETIRSHPVVGVGLNNWSVVVRDYDETGISALATDPVHNLYLLLWAETGIIGLLAFLAFIGSAMRAGIIAYAGSADKDVSATGLACAVAIAAILIMGLASWELRLAPESQVLWVIAGLAIAMHRMSADNTI